MTEREFALEVVCKLRAAGFAALWAGGCVRDEILGLTPADYDVATDATPQQLSPLFKRRNEIGAHFGVVQVIGPRGSDGEWLTVEVATFRIDGPYDPGGRTPGWVKFCSPEEDARRRDFTINGMFFDPIQNKLIDYVGGRGDLQDKVLRAIGNPAERFAEDKLRILRAVRMAARFNLTIDTDTLVAARQMAGEIRIVSAERIAEELRKMLTHPNRGRAVRLLREFGLIEPILPELIQGTGNPSPRVASPGWDFTEMMVNALNRDGAPVSFPLAFAVLLHALSRKQVEAIADRLRLSAAEKVRTAWLVEQQDCLDTAPIMPKSRLYPILVHPGIAELIDLHRARAMASGKSTPAAEFCESVLQETPRDVLDPPPLVTGEDLIALGMKPGREFKPLLSALRDAQLDGHVCDKNQALELVHRLRAGPGPGTPHE